MFLRSWRSKKAVRQVFRPTALFARFRTTIPKRSPFFASRHAATAGTVSAIIAASLLLAAAPAVAGDEYRAGYEITLRIGKAEWQIQTRSPLSVAVPIQHDFDHYKVSISLSAASESTYSITVEVTESGITSFRGVLLEHSFDGSFNGVLEFASENDLAAISGAIAVSPPR